jgi:hypothetical protein
MNEDLKEYISMRRNAINELLLPPADILSIIEFAQLKTILAEFDMMEEWFSE